MQTKPRANVEDFNKVCQHLSRYNLSSGDFGRLFVFHAFLSNNKCIVCEATPLCVNSLVYNQGSLIPEEGESDFDFFWVKLSVLFHLLQQVWMNVSPEYFFGKYRTSVDIDS